MLCAVRFSWHLRFSCHSSRIISNAVRNARAPPSPLKLRTSPHAHKAACQSAVSLAVLLHKSASALCARFYFLLKAVFDLTRALFNREQSKFAASPPAQLLKLVYNTKDARFSCIFTCHLYTTTDCSSPPAIQWELNEFAVLEGEDTMWTCKCLLQKLVNICQILLGWLVGCCFRG